MSINLFQKILGQDKAKDFLNKAWKSNRLASALLFYGKDSVGKNLTAYALSQALLCTKSPSEKSKLFEYACGNCSSCQEVREKRSPHILEIKPVNKVIKVEQSLEIISFLHLKSSSSSRIIIIDEAQYLNTQSSNKLLKTLEELSKNDYIILLSPSVKSLLSTVGSRLSKIAFSSLSEKDFLSITGGVVSNPHFFNSNLQDYKKWQSVLDLPIIKVVVQFWALLSQPNASVLSFVSKKLSKKEDIENFVYISQKCLLDKIKLNTSRLSELNEVLGVLTEKNCVGLIELLLILEKDIKNNISPLLSLENFCIKSGKQIHF